MKYLIALTLATLTTTYAAETDSKGQVTSTGSNIINNICQPITKVIIKPNKTCNTCNTCVKPKVVYKTRVVKVKSPPQIKTIRVVEKIEAKVKKNRVKLFGGFGPNGVSAATEGNKAVAYEEKGAVLGLSYDRLLNKTISVGAQIQTNETMLLSVGFDF